MSVRIGEVLPQVDQAAVFVHASTAGVELRSETSVTLDPVQARNYAALILRGADEVERMRRSGR